MGFINRIAALTTFFTVFSLFGSEGSVVINEIHYHPAPNCEREEFLELYNRTDRPVNLSGWRLVNGVRYEFAAGTFLEGKGYLILAINPEYLGDAFGIDKDLLLEFDGRLSNDGEPLVLLDASGNEVDRVEYTDLFPWPVSPDGGGPSLECINPAEDNLDARNWRPAGYTGPKWYHFSVRGQVEDQLLQIFLSGPGEFLIDDISLKDPESGVELLVNGGFEDDSLSSWNILGNHSSSARYTDAYHSGEACLKISATGEGGEQNGVFQVVPGLELSGPEYELSFWAKRISPQVRLKASVAGSSPVLAESKDIGSVEASGSTEENGGAYTIKGSGADIWNTADEFHYVYSEVSGDTEIEALVSWQGTPPNGWSKAGLMIRESDSPGSKHAMCILSRDNGVSLQYRSNTGGSSDHVPGPGLSNSARVRLERAGNTLTGSTYVDGHYEEVGSVQIDMKTDVLVGLAVTSHSDGDLATATFEEIQLNGRGAGLSVSTPLEAPSNESIATPLAANTQLREDVPPFVHEIQARAPTGDPDHPYKKRINSADETHITAKVEDSDPVSSVVLSYQVVEPGHYIRIEDEAYNKNWTAVEMFDDGAGPDMQGGDGYYTGLIPAQANRTLVRYRISATAGGQTTHVPYPDDTVPNLAYFVYDGVPDYVADRRSAHGPTPYVHKSEDLTVLPVYHFICKHDDMLRCEYDEIPFGAKRERKIFKWQGTLVFDPLQEDKTLQVYDNVRFRLRGGVWRYSWQKRMPKYRFPRGHYFKGQYNGGTRYPEKYKMVNLRPCIDQNWTGVRGITGLNEAMAFCLFRNAGVAAPHTTYIHLRYITREEEFLDQYHCDFRGIYLDMEQPKERLLDTNDRPDGNLYKIDSGAIGQLDGRPGKWDREVVDCTLSEDDSDVEYFYDTYHSGTQSRTWWENHLDLGRYYSYRAVLDSIKHYDIQAGKNYYYYHNSETGLWEVLPWDCDLILGATCCGDTTFGEGEPFWRRVIERYPNTFGVAYRNRLREYLQLLGNRDKIDPLIDRWVELLRDIHKADRDRWDYFPLPNPEPYGSRTERSPYHGLYRSIEQRVREQRHELSRRLAFVWSNRSNFCGMDATRIPDQPSVVSCPSETSLASSDLVFVASGFKDPDGNAQDAAFWQATRIRHAGEPGVQEYDIITNEMDPDWETVVYEEFTTCKIPADDVKTGEEYLVRVRYQDETGRKSLWSEPVKVKVVDSDSQKPEAVVSASPQMGKAPLTVTFDASSSSDPDGDPLKYSWDFGDGERGEGEVIQHEYTELGDYTVTLVVDDGRGRTDYVETVISVRNCSPAEALLLRGKGQETAEPLELEVEAGMEFLLELEAVFLNRGSQEQDGVRSWSFGVAHDPSVLELESVSLPSQTQEILTENAYTNLTPQPGGFTELVVISLTTHAALPAGVKELPVANAVYRLAAPHYTPGEEFTTTLRFSEALGSPPLEILVSRGEESAVPCELKSLPVTFRITAGSQQEMFLRGDANLDGKRDISDAVMVLSYLFTGNIDITCKDAADTNDDGKIDTGDPVTLLNFLFAIGDPLPPPSEAPGIDPTTDDPLDCLQGL